MVGSDYEPIERRVIESVDVSETILEYAKSGDADMCCDLIVIGATNEPLFRNLMVGNLVRKVAEDAEVTVLVVKRRSSPLHSFLRQTVLEPSTNGAGGDTASKSTPKTLFIRD